MWFMSFNAEMGFVFIDQMWFLAKVTIEKLSVYNTCDQQNRNLKPIYLQ